MSTPLIHECEHCDHAPSKTRKNLNIHITNSKLCAAKESKRPKPQPRRFNLDDPEDGGSGDEPAGVHGDEPVNIALDYLFDDFYNAVMTPDDDEAPAAGGPTEPDAANAQAGPEARVDGPQPIREGARQGLRYVSPDEKPWVHDFPKPAGVPKAKGKSEFEEIEELARKIGWGKWGPFEDKGDWELARWLFKNTNQTKINEFLSMEKVNSHRSTIHLKLTAGNLFRSKMT